MLRVKPDSSLFPTPLGKSRELGSRPITRFDGANLLKRRLRDAGINGDARSTIRRHLRAADRFGAWILKEGMSIVDINASIVDQVRGNAPRTRKIYLWYARRFLLERFGAEEPDWSTLEAEQIREFVRREAAKKHPSSCGQAVTGIRALLRFLVTKGVVRKGLERAVPSVRTWRHCSLPKHISPDEVQRVIEVCDTTTPLGLRERAVIYAIGAYGLVSRRSDPSKGQ